MFLVSVLWVCSKLSAYSFKMFTPHPAVSTANESSGLVPELGDKAADELWVGVQPLCLTCAHQQHCGAVAAPWTIPSVVVTWTWLFSLLPLSCGHVKVVWHESLLAEEPLTKWSEHREICVGHRTRCYHLTYSCQLIHTDIRVSSWKVTEGIAIVVVHSGGFLGWEGLDLRIEGRVQNCWQLQFSGLVSSRRCATCRREGHGKDRCASKLDFTRSINRPPNP